MIYQYEKYWPTKHHGTVYGKIIPIFKSSGMGKSRLVDEMGKRHLQLTFAHNAIRVHCYGWPLLLQKHWRLVSQSTASPGVQYSACKYALMRPGRDHRVGLEKPMVLTGTAKGAKPILYARMRLVENEGLLSQCKLSQRVQQVCPRDSGHGARPYGSKVLRSLNSMNIWLPTFLPKYHPELNPIEYVWGRSTNYLSPPKLLIFAASLTHHGSKVSGARSCDR
jgi:hypothetical protein